MKPIKLNIRVTRQKDKHSCGYCAMSSIFRFYDLDPRRENLRARLGTDVQLGRFTGTWPTDVLMVLFLYGFGAESYSSAYPEYKARLRQYLASGHPALALIYGADHWVVIAGMNDYGVLVLDSSGYADPGGKRRLRYWLSHEDFESMATGSILVQRGKRACTREMNSLDFIKYVKDTGIGIKISAKAINAEIEKCSNDTWRVIKKSVKTIRKEIKNRFGL
jgi:ABC-type bacteriocin/lantibiotic exporter with double-glycine peptidase domain